MEPQPFQEAYKVKAGDNLDYGPVNLGTLLDWVKDQRVLAGTLIHCQSNNSWQRAEAIPALREALLEVRRSRSEPEENMGEEISLEELRQQLLLDRANLDIETFYLVAKILLDWVARNIEWYFGQVRRFAGGFSEHTDFAAQREINHSFWGHAVHA